MWLQSLSSRSVANSTCDQFIRSLISCFSNVLSKVFNLFLIFSVNGGWTQWSEWSGCSPSCGPAQKYRKRSCTNPRPAHGGRVCVGPETSVERCRNVPCPVPADRKARWNQWGAWSQCTHRCGGGMQVCYDFVQTCRVFVHTVMWSIYFIVKYPCHFLTVSIWWSHPTQWPTPRCV